jgi:hypothetical protein
MMMSELKSNNFFLIKKMRLATLVITRNKSVHVRTLHTLLQLNMICMKNGIQQEITFCKDDPNEKNEMILKKMKNSDRLLFIDYAIQPDQQSLGKLLNKFDGYNCLVCPCVKEGVNWEQFKTKILNNSDEPIEQMGLEFDTELGQKMKDDIYKVTKTEPKCWSIDSKSVLRNLKDKKSDFIKLPTKNKEMFEKFKQKGVKIVAYRDSNVLSVFSHECLGNILNAAGVSQKTR